VDHPQTRLFQLPLTRAPAELCRHAVICGALQDAMLLWYSVDEKETCSKE
jgi:hypothetical protein